MNILELIKKSKTFFTLSTETREISIFNFRQCGNHLRCKVRCKVIDKGEEFSVRVEDESVVLFSDDGQIFYSIYTSAISGYPNSKNDLLEICEHTSVGISKPTKFIPDFELKIIC
jgi:hypothetical protein